METPKIDVLAAIDAMADSIANRRDDCIAEGKASLADFYRDMLASHRNARAAITELIEAATAVANFTTETQREKWSCHYGITTAAKCCRCSRELRLAAALARIDRAP